MGRQLLREVRLLSPLVCSKDRNSRLLLAAFDRKKKRKKKEAFALLTSKEILFPLSLSCSHSLPETPPPLMQTKTKTEMRLNTHSAAALSVTSLRGLRGRMTQAHGNERGALSTFLEPKRPTTHLSLLLHRPSPGPRFSLPLLPGPRWPAAGHAGCGSSGGATPVGAGAPAPARRARAAPRRLR